MDLTSFATCNNLQVKEIAVGNRTIQTTKTVQAGTVLLQEDPVISSYLKAEGSKHRLQPSESVELALDLQRLLDEWTFLKASNDKDVQAKLEALQTLSCDGVDSVIAVETDPERTQDYQRAAKQWVDKLRAKRKKKKPSEAVYSPSQADIYNLLKLIDTNSHSRPYQTANDEEMVGVYIAASLPNHSCLPNATVIIADEMEPHPMRLTLKSIRPIRAGEAITINYVDMEISSRELRRERLKKRGFLCQCEICHQPGWRDFANVASCQSCKGGLVALSYKNGWMCDLCKIEWDEGQVSAFDAAMKNTELSEELDDEEIENITEAYDRYLIQLFDLLETQLDDVKLALEGDDVFGHFEYPAMFPGFHPMNHQFYTYVKMITFDNPDFESVFGPRHHISLLWLLLTQIRLSAQIRDERDEALWFPWNDTEHVLSALLELQTTGVSPTLKRLETMLKEARRLLTLNPVQ
jgi:hypothetical protein